MKRACTIASYCSIRGNKVILDDKLLYKGPEDHFSDFASGVYKHFSVSYPKFHKMDNLGKLGFLAAEILLKGRDIINKYPADKTGIMLMNSSSSLDTDRNHQRTISNSNDYFPSPAVFVYTLPNVVIGEICIRHKFYGEGNFFIMEKFNPSFMVNYISQLFDNDIVDCCITGWVEIDGDNFESVLFLIEKSSRTETGIANFEPATIESIYNRK
ncbi:MAG: 3-oxoacyl-ACP synthase [Bacteroidia bacterium]|nr:3-oxoacyl-ACP synthase [Bacteroidia bacterium]